MALPPPTATITSQCPDLVCPAGSLPALKAAVDNGADAVYLGYKNDTNARNFAGLNFDPRPWPKASATPTPRAARC
jgi:collagenase-like PrtC family protease